MGTTIKYLRGAADIGLGATIKYLRGASCIGLGTTTKYLRTAVGIGLGTTAKELRRSTSGAAGNVLGTTPMYLRSTADICLSTAIKYLRRAASAATGNGLGTTIKLLVKKTRARASTGPRPATQRLVANFGDHPCSIAAFAVNSEPHTGARPSVRVCVRLGLSRCVHKKSTSQGGGFTYRLRLLLVAPTEVRCEFLKSSFFVVAVFLWPNRVIIKINMHREATRNP
jgi:hypothetical protein